MKAIARESAQETDKVLTAPQNAAIKRVDEVTAARKPIVKWEAP